MAEAHTKNHDYHLVEPSPWPFIGSVGAFIMAIGAIAWMKAAGGNDFTLFGMNLAGTSWMLENRAPHIVAGDYTPHSQVDIWPKDLGIVLDTAKAAKFSAPLTAAALQQFIAASGQGLGGEDDAAVAKVYARNAGLSLPGEDD